MTRSPSSGFISNRRLRRQVLCGALALCAAAMFPLRVSAHPPEEDGGPVLLWGIQRGCDGDPSAERAVLARLQSFAGSQLHRIQRVGVAADAESRNCLGEQCAKLLRDACPDLNGQILGGEIDDLVIPDASGKALMSRLRLWRHDLSTQRTFYQSRLCTRGLCGDQPVAETVAQMAAQLLERPGFEADARAFTVVRAERLPLCGADSVPALGAAPPAAERSKSVERLYQQIYLTLVIDPLIADQHKSIQDLFARTLPLLKLDGFRDHPLPVEVRAPDPGAPDAAWVQRTLAAATAGRTLAERKLPARLLVLQIGKRGDALTLDFHWLPSSEAEAREYDFPAAGYSPQAPLTLGLLEVNALAATLRNERAAQLGRLRTVAERPAAGADTCQPMPAPRCAQATLAAVPISLASTAPGQALAPKLAQGALWGVFAASAATFIALTALDQAHVGDLPVDGTRSVGGSLRAGMGVSGGIAALSLGLAIPTTLLFRQNGAQPPRQIVRSAAACRLLRDIR